MKYISIFIPIIIAFSIGGCTMSETAGNEQTETTQFIIHPIGTVVKENDKTMIILDKKYQPGLSGLEKHSHVHVVYWFDRNDTPEGRAVLQVHPRGDKNNPLTGVFATHSPFRPNLIAISKCNLISIHENVIEIEDIDAFDGTPVIDLKGDFFMFNPK
jgi:tRNA-Thr(GGU) m(6)t(6)A37 methyltransferase TsaA